MRLSVFCVRNCSLCGGSKDLLKLGVAQISFCGTRLCVLETEGQQEKYTHSHKSAGRRSVPAMWDFSSDCWASLIEYHLD